LTGLNIESNEIWGEGAKYLAESLKANKNLKYINLYNNKIKCIGCICIANALKTKTILNQIDLNKNNLWA
jgi:hypothetical protein